MDHLTLSYNERFIKKEKEEEQERRVKRMELRNPGIPNTSLLEGKIMEKMRKGCRERWKTSPEYQREKKNGKRLYKLFSH